ncbi:hypothetical protein CR513_33166, partial [Mucuna pruriens]
MSLLVILSPSLKVISSVLSRLIGALSWSLMTTFVDNKQNGSSAFGGILSSYFSGSLMDTYGLAPAIVVLVKEQPRFTTARKKSLFFLLLLCSLKNHRNSSYCQISQIQNQNQIQIFFLVNLLVNLSSDVVSVRDFIGFVIVFQIIGAAPRGTRRDIRDVVLRRFPHLLPLEPLVFLIA